MEAMTGESSTSGKRIEWIDAAKGIGILLVIFAHLNTGVLGKWIYSFHMPLFFMLSGCVFKASGSFKDLLKKKFRTIIIPYIFLGAVMAVFQFCRNWYEGRFSIHSSLVICVELAMQIRYWTLWYLACLLGLNILFYFLVRYVKDSRLLTGIVFLLTIGGVIYAKCSLPFLPWNIDAVFPASLFFYCGYLIRRHSGTLAEKCRGNKWLVALILSLAANLICYHANLKISGLPLEMNTSQYGIAVLTYSAAIGGSLFVVLLAQKCTEISWLKYIGRNSLLYYAWHQQIFIPLLRYIFIWLGIRQTGFQLEISQIGVDLGKTVIIVLALTGLNKLIRRSKFSFLLGA